MSTESKPRFRVNDTRLRPENCPRCHLPTLTGWDDELMAQQVRLHPATIDHTNAVAALYLGHEVTEVKGNHHTGFRAHQTLRPERVQYVEFTHTNRTKQYMIPHKCGHFLRLDYQPIPNPQPDVEEFDLFNQPPADNDLPPY